MARPANTPVRQRIILITIYIVASANRPFSYKVRASNENVENVVSPPQKPVFRQVVHVGESFPGIRPTMNPMKMAPMRFAMSVGQGNAACKNGIWAMRLRNAAPQAPPNATDSIVSMMFTRCFDVIV